MTERKSYEEISRFTITVDNDKKSIKTEHVTTGCLQRIADATEKMAANYDQMRCDKEMYERRYRESQEAVARMRLSRSALRGVITKLKAKERGDG